MSNPLPASGNVYSFRTAPLSEFAPQATNRFAAFKVLGSNASHVVVAVLDAIWRTPPSPDDVCTLRILREHRFFHTGRPAVFEVNADWWTLHELNEMRLLGPMALTAEELQFASNIFSFEPGSTFSTLHAANHAAEGEWRWANDRESLVEEHQRVQALQAAKRAAQEERYRNRLRSLTWEQLLEETPFERWSSSPPFPSADFTKGAREVVHNACRALQALGSKPRKADVRNVLRKCVQWFNAADEQAGGAIETEEREDICAVLEEMAHVAKQKSLVDEVDNWRTW
ncbi:MAG TPA: hypothetical protein DHW63_12320 [Hyphomonadaceae bacterium]|nr:hypothetical protein [Hyphomonadaceae bacterium]